MYSGRAAFGGAAGALVVTKVLIGLNVLAYVAMYASGGTALRRQGSLFQSWALYGPAVAGGEWYRLVTGGFLHGGLLHLGMNMFLLWLLGQVLEPALGRVQFAVLYVVSLLGGSLGVMLLDPRAPTIGASGAVFGLMGAMVVLNLRAGQNPFQNGIGTLVVINLALTFILPGISVGGHVGGLLAGALAALGLHTGRARSGEQVARVGGLVAMGALLGVASVMVATNQFPAITI